MKKNKRYFARVRPYIHPSALEQVINQRDREYQFAHTSERSSEQAHFFFSSGRASLKWVLHLLRQRSQKPLRVGVQAFTCHVVVQAILESDNMPVFFDITPEYYTTRLHDILFEEIDILLLTHLFGIPNPDYFEICKICKSKEIIVIDDLALTFRASLNGQEIGSAGDAAFYSFGFDKPVSCYEGGLLRVNNAELIRELDLRRQFTQLPQETERRQLDDLKKLQVFYTLFDQRSYRPGFSYTVSNAWLALMSLFSSSVTSMRTVLGIFQHVRKFGAVVDLFRRNRRHCIEILRMGTIKHSYLQTLWDHYPHIHQARLFAAKNATQHIHRMFKEASFPELADDMYPCWHRLPVLLPENARDKLIQWGKTHGIEIGGFNWPILCFEPFDECKQILPEHFPHSNDVKKHIVNVPLWTEEIWKF